MAAVLNREYNSSIFPGNFLIVDAASALHKQVIHPSFVYLTEFQIRLFSFEIKY